MASPSLFPTITTVRLILRELKKEDANEIFFLRTNERVNQFLDREKATVLQDALDHIQKIETGIAKHRWMYWAISLKEMHSLIGTIGLFNVNNEKETAEIGYELNPAFFGQGIMQEAIEPVIQFAFEQMNIKTLTAFTKSDNEKSVDLLKRNHFNLDSNHTYAPEGELENMRCYYLQRK